MNKEKLITCLLSVLLCLLEWAAVITVLVILRMNFNFFWAALLFFAWTVTYGFVKEKVRMHYEQNNNYDK